MRNSANPIALYLLKSCVLILVAIHIVSCNSSTSDKVEDMPPPEPVVLNLEDKGIKTFLLDSLVNFERLINLQVNEFKGREYLSFFNMSGSMFERKYAFYIHDYESGDLVQKTPLAIEGPDKVQVFAGPDYHLHSLDSIFINTEVYGQFLVNAEGKVLNKIVKKGSGFSRPEMQIIFNESSYYHEGSIHGSIKSHDKASLFPFLRGKINFDNGKTTTDSIHSSAIFDNYNEILDFLKEAKENNKLYVNIHRQIMLHDAYLYATTIISDSIRVFKNQQLIESIYAGLPEYEIVDYKTYFNNKEIIMSKSSSGKGSGGAKLVFNQPPTYLSTLIDPQGKFIYRIVSHGTKLGRNPTKGRFYGEEMAVVSGATLLVINLETKELYSFELPIENIEITDSRHIFVSNSGIHFRLKEQENEDQVQFRVFGIGIPIDITLKTSLLSIKQTTVYQSLDSSKNE